MTRLVRTLLVAAALVTAPILAVAAPVTQAAERPALFYHVFVRSFADSNGEYGSKADFWALVDNLHRRGMRIVLDEEIQYVTGQHERFQSSHDNSASPISSHLLFRDKANHTEQTIRD